MYTALWEIFKNQSSFSTVGWKYLAFLYSAVQDLVSAYACGIHSGIFGYWVFYCKTQLCTAYLKQ